MSDKRWKRAERKLAAMFGSKRTGPLGKDVPDFTTDELAVEVKDRETLPAWLLGAMEQAETNAPKGKTPVVILHQARAKYEDGLVLLRVGDLLDLMDEPGDTV